MEKKEITLSFGSTYENIEAAGLCVHAICLDVEMSADDCNLVHSAVIEALTNILKHAYENVLNMPIEMYLTNSDNNIVISIRDIGKPWLQKKPVKLKFDPHDISSIRESGMGIPIIYMAMDNITRIENNGKNVLTMTKSINRN
jgi:serine/threonine-protein kinase RsbW